MWGDNGEHAVSDTAWFETARMKESWEGKWIGCSKLKDTNPVLIKEFTTDKAYKKSRIYITGLGLYELYLDGERVGNEYLTPGCTDYNRWIQYQTYEVQFRNEQKKFFLGEIRSGSCRQQLWRSAQDDFGAGDAGRAGRGG